jgi:hypothetical protein
MCVRERWQDKVEAFAGLMAELAQLTAEAGPVSPCQGRVPVNIPRDPLSIFPVIPCQYPP